MENKPQKKSKLKRNLLIILLVIIAIPTLEAILRSTTDENRYEYVQKLDSATIAEFKADSIFGAKQDSIYRAHKDSVEKAKEAKNLATVKKLKKNFRVSVDEFKEKSWIYHRTTARYTNMNSVHLYFQQSESGRVSNLRFRVQYEDDSWLFIESMIFNIDGENITFYPDEMERDCGNGGRIWEWCDEQARLTPMLITKISNAKNVKIKFDGKQYYDTRKMSKTQLRAFKETLQYYFALGGEL